MHVTHAWGLDTPELPEYVPGMQGMHALGDIAPIVADHVPAGQGLGSTVPDLSQTEPAGQGVHTASDAAASCVE